MVIVLLWGGSCGLLGFGVDLVSVAVGFMQLRACLVG